MSEFPTTESHLAAALLTIEAMKQRIVTLEFEIVDMMSANLRTHGPIPEDEEQLTVVGETITDQEGE